MRFVVVLLSVLSFNAWALEPALNDDVAGLRLGDTRADEQALSPRAKPWVRVYYDENDVIQGIRYRQPGLSNEDANKLSLINRLCGKYGNNNFCAVARQNLQRDPEEWVGFISMYEVEGGRLKAQVLREQTFSFFPRLMVNIELTREGFEFPDPQAR